MIIYIDVSLLFLLHVTVYLLCTNKRNNNIVQPLVEALKLVDLMFIELLELFAESITPIAFLKSITPSPENV